MQKVKATIIDYGVGNLLSVRRGLERVGADVCITSDAGELREATHVILPGVGAFSNAMDALASLGLIEIIQEISNKGTPLLAICLGMQLLLDESEEFGITKGLGLIPGRVIPVPSQGEFEQLKIPHIGWNELEGLKNLNAWNQTILADVQVGDSVYFVHSFMAVPQSENHLLATCNYGGNHIPAVIHRDNITGCQFHPEKSGEIGLKILKKFLS
ncbi:imidazole glycerol phosphate synthase subunit HisH [Leptospira brenneri]|uniref:imidazole glycerol phosphate synthase subunit HisH n=1 Tax=Leptospira brenneri TaxID=2023182 RepID=UPI000C29A478|nr:imidazole glycerol phosphate synthase subunit HisH [Leptospira brenneri]PJZ45521.1 imidazole glycerol phosphate synthase subunit HisH [Leptospira brenneri]